MTPEEMQAMIQQLSGGQPSADVAGASAGTPPPGLMPNLPLPQTPSPQPISAPPMGAPSPPMMPPQVPPAAIPTPPSGKAAIGQMIGDFLQAMGAGLSNRGKAGQSTGAGAAMQTPFLLAAERQKQALAQHQLNVSNALKQAQLDSLEKERISQEGVLKERARLLEMVPATWDPDAHALYEDPNGKARVQRGELEKYSTARRGQESVAGTAAAKEVGEQSRLNQRLGATSTENLLNRQATAANAQAGLASKTQVLMDKQGKPIVTAYDPNTQQ